MRLLSLPGLLNLPSLQPPDMSLLSLLSLQSPLSLQDFELWGLGRPFRLRRLVGHYGRVGEDSVDTEDTEDPVDGSW